MQQALTFSKVSKKAFQKNRKASSFKKIKKSKD